jgi:hypothetical protein
VTPFDDRPQVVVKDLAQLRVIEKWPGEAAEVGCWSGP